MIALGQNGEMIEQLLDGLGIRPEEPALFVQALTHPSYISRSGGEAAHNERLEFLGDAVVDLVVSHHLFAEYPDASEGVLTRTRARIVCEKALSEAAISLNLGDYVRLGKSEDNQRRQKGQLRRALLADLFEAFLGAIYLDRGYARAGKFALEVLRPIIERVTREPGVNDPKTELQEKLQAQGISPPRYILVEQSGPDHDPTFVVEGRVEDMTAAKGKGGSLQKAERRAAQRILRKMKRSGML